VKVFLCRQTIVLGSSAPSTTSSTEHSGQNLTIVFKTVFCQIADVDINIFNGGRSVYSIEKLFINLTQELKQAESSAKSNIKELILFSFEISLISFKFLSTTATNKITSSTDMDDNS
jgi:hypothetical protein